MDLWRRVAIAAIAIFNAVALPACSGGSTADTQTIETQNFVAEVSGARVSGPGLIQFIPPSSSGLGSQTGYFAIADDSGIRDFGITFTIPVGTKPGTYPLVTANPADVGKAFEVRVDVDKPAENRTESFQFKTEGTIAIEAFPIDADSMVGSRVAGTFEFFTQDDSNRMISAKGTFDFLGK